MSARGNRVCNACGRKGPVCEFYRPSHGRQAMRGTKERFAKYAPLLPQSQGITSPAVEPRKINHDDCNCVVCGKRVGDHSDAEVLFCAIKGGFQLPIPAGAVLQ